MIDIQNFQERLNTEDNFSVLDEMFALQAELQQNKKLTYTDAFGMYNFLRQNTNAHLSYVLDKESYEKNSTQEAVSNALVSFSSTLPFEQRCEYIGLLLEKSSKAFNVELKQILIDNPDVVEHIRANSLIPIEKTVIEYPLCICAENCDVYGIEYKEGEEYGYSLHYEPKVNYIEYLLFKDGNRVGLVDDLTFLKHFIYE